ncbi:MAG: helix-turn-helix domain-containing protein [Rickettsiales bacterium]
MNPTPASETASEPTTQRVIGAQMAALRASFNLTQQEVSERLHIRARYISAMEEGRYELMPGKVYARGYVHTYAEFLGLNPDQIVAQCFAGEPASAAQPVPATPRTVPNAAARVSSNWRAYALMGIVGFVVILIISQLVGASKSSDPAVAGVAPVPEDMLASVRNMVMPTSQNYTCLTSKRVLGCFYTDGVSRELASVMRPIATQFSPRIDVAALMIVAEEEPEAVESEDTEDNVKQEENPIAEEAIPEKGKKPDEKPVENKAEKPTEDMKKPEPEKLVKKLKPVDDTPVDEPSLEPQVGDNDGVSFDRLIPDVTHE